MPEATIAVGPAAGGGCLVALRPGGGTPLFIVHGLGGAVAELHDLALQLDTDGPVYGIEARGLDGSTPPLDRVEDMAAAHLAELRRLQPTGPYRLAGFSFGGLVALEMAQHLTRAGETVGFLCLLDTYPDAALWPLRYRVVAWLRLSRFWLSPTLWRSMVRHYGGLLRGMPPAQRRAFVASRARRAGGILFSIFGAADRANIFVRRAGEPSGPRPPDPPAFRRVQAAARAALAAYRPAAYAGDTVFVKAADMPLLPFNAQTLWRPLLPRLEVHVMPGDHHALVRGNVAQLARLLSAALHRAASRTRISNMAAIR